MQGNLDKIQNCFGRAQNKVIEENEDALIKDLGIKSKTNQEAQQSHLKAYVGVELLRRLTRELEGEINVDKC